LAVLECRSPVQTQTGNAQEGKLHRQFIPRLTARVVSRRLVNRGDLAIGKGGGIEARRPMGVLVEPEAERILWLQRVLLLLRKFAPVSIVLRLHLGEELDELARVT